MDEANAALLAEEGMAVEGVFGVCGMGGKPKPLTAWYGGKARLAPIIARMVEKIPHKNYVEPFAGMFAVLLAKQPSYSELVNDLNQDLVNLFRVVQNPVSCVDLVRRLNFTPHARAEWRYCQANFSTHPDSIERARMLYVVLAQNFVGETKNGSWSFGGPKYKGNVAAEFSNSLTNIHAVCRRLQNVALDCADALTIMRQWDNPETVMYLDPPYVLSTRNSTGYAHETPDSFHHALLTFCQSAESAIILSGYASLMYADALESNGWHRLDFVGLSSAALNSTANGRKNNPTAKTAKRTECLWLNPKAQAAQNPTLWEGLSA